MNRLIKIVALILTVVFMLAGCTSKPVNPIPYLEYKNPNEIDGDKKLLVMLRGLGGGHEIFEEHGLIDGVFENDYPFDIIAPAAHAGYYRAESLSKRLYQDIILPARQNGYKEVWIAGTSMGGLGALMYLTNYPDTVDGVILLSPFLGWSGILDEIEEAGSLKAWIPGDFTDEDWQRRLWSWLQAYEQDPVKDTQIYIGYGNKDFFNQGHQLLSKSLPEGHSTVVNGGHTYSTLRALWSEKLNSLQQQLSR